MIIGGGVKERIKTRVSDFSQEIMRYLMNEMPTRLVNASYNYYSMLYQGQLRLGLPVTKELLQSQQEIQVRAAGKLALTLYHMCFHVTGSHFISRSTIKSILLDELEKKRLRLTEKVIILNQRELEYLVLERFQIPKRFLPEIIARARHRRILKETIQSQRQSAYFESEIEEREENGRGDYEIVYYKDYTDDGKELGFQRLASIEDVHTGDNNPSILLVPGFAENSNVYNLSNRYSLAKDLADQAMWVYLFDARGMGVNEGKFDPFSTVDTLIDYDLPTVAKFVHARSKGKPIILSGHSMGGLVSENMVLNWNLRRNWNRLSPMGGTVMAALDQILPPVAEATRNLKMIRGIITMGSPKNFERNSHLIYPSVLWLNHLSRIFRLQNVPISEFFWVLTQLPFVGEITRCVMNSDIGEWNILLNPENHKNDRLFAELFLNRGLDSVPLGLGFQFLKAIYNGEGFKRMDASRLNYTDYLQYFPDNIPVFHFYGTKDPLAPPKNSRYTKFYPHRTKKLYYLSTPDDLCKIEITPERSQVIDFVIEGANHIDLIYGKAANEIIYPLITEIIDKVWDDWSYEYCGDTCLFEPQPAKAVG